MLRNLVEFCSSAMRYAWFRKRNTAKCRIALLCAQTNKTGKAKAFPVLLVEMTGLEPAASCSQSRRATNCATSRYEIVRWNCGILGFAASCGARNDLLAYCFTSFRPLCHPCLAVSSAGRARQRCPKQARYQLRYTPNQTD